MYKKISEADPPFQLAKADSKQGFTSMASLTLALVTMQMGVLSSERLRGDADLEMRLGVQC